MSTENLIGKEFHRLTVTRRAPNFGRRKNKVAWFCQCVCGKEVVVEGYRLRKDLTKSCGCLVTEINADRLRKHGRRWTIEYTRWLHMRQRCLNKRNPDYRYYGARGISIDPRWDSFTNFLADMGPMPFPQAELDRIDNNGPYCMDNCRWATRTQQNRNSRHNHLITFRGETRCISEWKEITGITALNDRISRGWTVERALTTPQKTKSPEEQAPLPPLPHGTVVDHEGVRTGVVDHQTCRRTGDGIN